MRKNICSVFLVLSFLAGLLTMPVRAFTIPQKPGDYLWQYTEGLEAGNGGSYGGGDSDIHVWVNNQSGDQPVRQLDVIVYSDGIRLGKQGAVVTLADGTVYQGRVTTYADGFHISFPLDAPITGWYECFVSLEGENGSLPLAVVRLVNGSGSVSSGNVPYWDTAQVTQGETDSVLSLVTVSKGVWTMKTEPPQDIAPSGQKLSLADYCKPNGIVQAGVSLAVKADGSLWAWGYNTNGEVGNGAWRGSVYTPVQVMEGVKSVYADGSGHSYAIKTDGSLWGWGRNSFGDLGDGTQEDRLTPVKIMDGVAFVTHGALIKEDGGLWMWGLNTHGQLLGTGVPQNQPAPMKVMDDVVSVVHLSTSYGTAGSGQNTYALRSDGSLWAWGSNNYGQVGNGSRTWTYGSSDDNVEPVQVLDDVVSIGAENGVAAAVTADGGLWVWGRSWQDGPGREYGGSFYSSAAGGSIPYYIASTPVRVAESAVKVWCTTDGTWYLKEDGTLWSYEVQGRQEQVLSQVADFQSYSGSHFALQTDGSLWAWGDNPYGNLGNGTMDYVEHPVKITDHVVAVSPHSATLAVKQDGSLWGWGSDSNGQLGQGSTTWSAVPIHIMDGVKLPEGTEEAPRSDAPSSWAQDVVSAAIAAGIVPENLQQNYTEAVSRGEVAEMFIRLLEKSSGKDINAILAEKGVQINPTAFTDTTDKNVLAANALGIISGVGNNRFDPNGTFTRAQIAAILNRTAEVLGVETDGYTHTFTDVSGHWVSDSLGWPVHAGIINGVGNNRFAPDSVLTAEQSIVMAQRALEALSISQ